MNKISPIPECISFSWSDEESAGCFVAIGEGVRDADGCLLKSSPTEACATLGAFLWHEETKNIFVTVTEFDHALLHGRRASGASNCSLCSLAPSASFWQPDHYRNGGQQVCFSSLTSADHL